MDRFMSRSPKLLASALIASCALSMSSSLVAGPSPVDRIVDAACSKDVVLLGELPSHGEAMAFAAKAEVVRRLVEHCDFNLVLFEAPVYEFEAMRPPYVDDLHVSDLENAIGRFWTTRELSEWRVWLLQQARTGRVRLGGIDDQISATSLRTREMLPTLIADVDTTANARCREVVHRHLAWSYDSQFPFDLAEKERLVACATPRSDPSTTNGVMSAGSALSAAFHRYAVRQSQPKEGVTRDDSMHQTLQWHLSRAPEPTRAIVWTSTVHAAREPGGRQYIPLGHRLAKDHGARMLSVGFTAQAGLSSMAGSKPKSLDPAPPGSLEAAALEGAQDARYLDKQALAEMDGRESRLYGEFGRHPWSRHFDAVVVFKTESAPTAGNLSP